MTDRYRIVRFRQNGRRKTIRTGMTLADAQAWCSRTDTHGIRAGIRWFDGYEKIEDGRRGYKSCRLDREGTP